MSASIALRHARRLSTAATTAPVTISFAKSRLLKAQDPDEALKIYSSFTAANDPTTSPSSTRHAQEFTVRLLAKSRRFSEIESFLEPHKSNPQITDEPYLSSLIRSYGIAGMIDNAVKTYNEMSELGTPRGSFSFNALLSACVHSKVFDRVPVYFNEFPEKFGFLPDKYSYGILIRSYCEMGKPDIAMEKLSEMEEKEIEVEPVVFSTILHSLYKGRSEEAEKFWDEMVNVKGRKPDVATYNVRLSHVHRGDPEGVKEVIEEMKKVELEPDVVTYNYLMTCYCEKGMMDEAKKVYDEILKVKGCNPNKATFRTLVYHSCKHERYVTAYKVFKESVNQRKIPDFNTLKYLLEGLVRKGHKYEAKGMVRTMNKKFPSNLLKAWAKLAEDLAVAPTAADEADSANTEKVVDSAETEKVTA